MKNNKAAVIWLVALTLSLAALFALSLRAGRAGYGNLLMVTPNTLSATGLGAEKLDEFSSGEFPAEKFLLTYAIRKPATAQAINSRHSAALVGTNHNWTGVMGYAVLDGGFLTKTAADTKSKQVALNETAAFRMFGSVRVTGSILKIDGEAWIVAGVIQDNDAENSNLYVPASVIGGRADSIMVLMGGSVTEAYVKSALKSVGVRDSNYAFINLSRLAEAFGERFSVAWKAAVSAAALLFVLGSGERLIERLRFYRDRMRHMYFGELIVRYRRDFLKTAAGLAAFAAGIAAMLALSLQIMGACLTWGELIPITGELTAGELGGKLLWLRSYQIFDGVLFWGCICLIIAGLVAALFRRTGQRTDGREAGMLYGESEPAQHMQSISGRRNGCKQPQP